MFFESGYFHSPKGMYTSFIKKLYAAEKYIDMDLIDDAEGVLGAFINQAEAQSGKHLDENASKILIADAEYVISNQNQGTVTEDVTVEIYYDYNPAVSVPIETKTVRSIAAGANQPVSFTWDTTNMLTATHRITAIVSGLLGETDTEDNMRNSDTTLTIKEKIEPPIPTELIIGIAVAVLAVIIIVLVVLRRGKKPIPE
jgi:hypothetical protein